MKHTTRIRSVITGDDLIFEVGREYALGGGNTWKLMWIGNLRNRQGFRLKFKCIKTEKEKFLTTDEAEKRIINQLKRPFSRLTASK
jgi:hypothetical protein